MYGSGRLIVVRELDDAELGGCEKEEEKEERRVKAFVYRGHTAQVTAAKFSRSGCYIASGDIRGKIRVWSYDNEEHLCKLELTALAGPIRDISWDCDDRRLCIVGESSKTDSSSPCCRVVQWDTGVTCGELGFHARGRASSCDFRPGRPMRIVTGGADDARCMFHKGPPFQRLLVESCEENGGKSSEYSHARGSVHCVRYDPKGEQIASVGTDRSVCFYEGKTMSFKGRMEDVHSASIYSCAFDSTGTRLITCSADGTASLIDAIERKVLHIWHIADHKKVTADISSEDDGNGKVPIGAMQKGCAFLSDDTPISIGHNGHISVLPYPSDHIPAGTTTPPTNIEKIRLLTGHQAPIDAFALHHESDTMYTADSDGIVVRWTASTGHAQARLNPPPGTDTDLSNKIHSGAITSVVVLDENTVLTTAWDDTLKISTNLPKNGGDEITTQVTQSLDLPAQPNAMSKGTNVVVILTVQGLLLYHDSTISEMITLPYEPTAICLSEDDTTLYVASPDYKIYVYTLSPTADNPLEEKHVIANGHLKTVHTLSLSHDQTKLASADTRDVCVWSTSDYTPIVSKSRWCFHTQKITCVTWSNDDSILASGGNDDCIYLWCLKKKMKRIHYKFAHRGGITGLSFLKYNGNGEDEKRMILVSSGIDACVNHWDVTDDVATKFG